MKITFKNRKFRFGVCLCLILCGLNLVACKQESKAEVQEKFDVSTTTPGNFQSYPAAVRGTIFRTLTARGMVKTKPFSPTIEDIRRLSFLMPGEPGYDAHSGWAVFCEKNGGKTMLENFRGKMDKVLPGGRFYITLSNRVEGLGSERPELIAIFPHFPAHLCGKVIGDVFEIPREGLKIPVSDPPNLLSPPAIAEEKNIGAVPLMGGWPHKDLVLGCYKDRKDVHYYYQVLFSF